MARLAIRMPKMSMTMTEGEVSTWLVDVGATVAVGDVVCEVMTDKVDMEVESTVAGELVEIVHADGIVPVGDPIAWVEGEDDGGGFGDLLMAPPPEPEPAPAPDLPAGEPVPDADPSATEQTGGAHAGPPTEDVDERVGPVPAVPRARGLAREHGIDLVAVAATGPDGLVRVGDVEALVRPAAPAPTPTPPAPAAPAAPAPAPAPKAPVSNDRRTAVRQAVARAMVPSAAIPQFTVWRVMDLDTANTVRGRVSWTTVLLRAYAAALRDVPELLSRWEDGRPTEPGEPSIALAVATDRGLLVPTFTAPDRGTAAERDAELRAVVRTAQAGKVEPAYMAFANASLSNLGGQGVDRFQALLTPPQASVLSVGSIKHRPVAVPGGVGTALTVELGLTVDHRVADGAHGADLLEGITRILSANPLT